MVLYCTCLDAKLAMCEKMAGADQAVNTNRHRGGAGSLAASPSGVVKEIEFEDDEINAIITQTFQTHFDKQEFK